jgi:cobaltochelatase CobS
MAEMTIDEFRQEFRKLEVRCLVCSNFSSHSIVGHLRERHQMSPGQYRKRFPLETYPHAKVASQATVQLLAQLNRNPVLTNDLGELLEAAGLTRRNATPIGGDGWTKELAALMAKMPEATGPEAAEFPIPEAKAHYTFPTKETRMLSASLAMGKNAYISGPPGCGKTILAEQILNRANRRYVRVNMNGGTTVAKFIGAMQANPAQGTFYKEGILPRVMRAGVPLLLDEVDYMSPHIAAVFNPVLEPARRLFLEESGAAITAAPGFAIVATGNTAGKGDETGIYTGTEVLNSAFIDRFDVKLSMDYPTAAEEEAVLLRAFPAADPIKVGRVCKVAQEMRQAFLAGSLTFPTSRRKTEQWVEFALIFGWEDAFQTSILNWLPADEKAAVLEVSNRVSKSPW